MEEFLFLGPKTILQNDLVTTKNTVVLHEDEVDMKYNAPHHFEVYDVHTCGKGSPKLVGKVDFQEGPVKECGINGIANEDAIAMVLARLLCFQKTPYACKENEMAITKLEETLMWLRKRTLGREKKGTVGTSKV